MMSRPAKLSDLLEALLLPDAWEAWLDRETGRVYLRGEDGLAGEADEEEDVRALKAIDAGDPRYLALPGKFDFDEYRHLERFIAGLEDARIADQLWRAIKGKGAFRRFKDTANRLGVLQEWYDYLQRAQESFMLEWAELNGIALEPANENPGDHLPGKS